MADSKVWSQMTPEEKTIKRREYRANYKKRHPERMKEFSRAYKERNKKVLQEKATIRQKEKGRANKLKAIEYKGNQCFDCKQSFHQCCYDFHHLDPAQKDISIARIIGRNFEKIKPELDKCVLLCAHCHRLRHFNESE